MAKRRKAKQSKTLSSILYVEIIEASPNKMFTEEQRFWVRFLRYSRWIKCAACGKKRKVMWTMLHEFIAVTMDGIAGTGHTGPYPPLTPVCGDHPIGPPTESESKKAGP